VITAVHELERVCGRKTTWVFFPENRVKFRRNILPWPSFEWIGFQYE